MDTRRKLNENQLKLVEDYHYAIYCVSKKMSTPIQEIYGIAAIRLCEAAISYSGDYNNFFNYAFTSIKYAIISEFKSIKKHKHDELFDMPVEDNFDDLYNEDFKFRFWLNYRKFFSPVERTALNMVMDGFHCTDISLSNARIRALSKCEKILNGETLPIYRIPPNKKIKTKVVDLMAHRYSLEKVSSITGLSGRTIRKYYKQAGKPKYNTSADIARLLNVDRSTVLKHAKNPVKNNGKWEIRHIPKIKKPSENHSKSYSKQDAELLLSKLPDYIVADQIGRSSNAVHIKRWRMKNDDKGEIKINDQC